MKDYKKKYCFIVGEYYKDILGQTYKNVNDLEYEVMCYGYQKNGSVYYQVRFLVNGYITFATRDSIRKNKVPNPYVESKLGEFCYGKVDKQGVNFMKLRSRWEDMIDRCYNTRSKDYDKSGGKGITIDPRWHVLEWFIHDVTRFKTYHPALVRDGLAHIDKDYYQRNIKDTKNMSYSKETCQWLWHSFNCGFTKRMPPIIRLTSSTGSIVIEELDVTKAAKKARLKAHIVRASFNRAKKLCTKNWVMIGSWKLEALKNKN